VTDVIVHTEPARIQAQVIPDDMLRQSLQLPARKPMPPHKQ
jgi:hypothetical protein